MTVSSDRDQTEPLRFSDAIELVRPLFATLEKDDLLTINVDPIEAVSTIGGVLPRLQTLRSSIIENFTHFDIAHLDRLWTYARALMHTHGAYLAKTQRPKELGQVSKEAAELRDLLLSDVTALVKRQRIQFPRLSSGRGHRSYIDIASDVLTLATVLRDSWDSLSSSCAVSEAELDRAEVLSARLVELAGRRAHSPEAVALAALERQKAYTLLVRSYAQVRKAVTYLRTEAGDADEYAPSLRAKQSGRKKKTRDAAPATILESVELPSTAPTDDLVAQPVVPVAPVITDPFAP